MTNSDAAPGIATESTPNWRVFSEFGWLRVLSRAVGYLDLFGRRGSSTVPRAATTRARRRPKPIHIEETGPGRNALKALVTSASVHHYETGGSEKLKAMSELSFRPARVPTNDSKNSVTSSTNSRTPMSNGVAAVGPSRRAPSRATTA